MTMTNSTFSLFRGESRELQIQIWDQDNNMMPLNLTGASLQFELYREPAHTLIMSKNNTSLGLSVIDYTNGIVQVVLNSTDTKYLVFGSAYIYYLRVTNAADQSSVVTKGAINLIK